MADTPLKPLISTDPGERSRLWPALLSMLRQFEIRSDQLLPATVISYDRTANVATVQPLIMLVTVGGDTIQRHPLTQVPALSLGAGGFHIGFPIAPGDLGWIFAADRDMSLFKQSLAQSAPNSTRLHSFADGMFIPDVFRKYVINAEDADAMVVQTTDGTTRVSIRNDGTIKITAPTSITIDAPTAHFTGDVVIDKNLTVEQNANIVGTLTNNGIDVTTHGHKSNGTGVRTDNMEA